MIPNVFHKNYTLDNNHALHARQYADIAARDADTAFNTDSANIGKAILVDSPASVYTLLTTAPLFLEFSNTMAGDDLTSIQGQAVAFADAGADALWGWVDGESTYRNLTQGEAQAIIGGAAGNVFTADVLTANQLLSGQDTTTIVTEPNLVFSSNMLGIRVTDPLSPLHVFEDTTSTLSNAGVTIQQDGIGHAVTQYIRGGTRWVCGVSGSTFHIQDSLGLDSTAVFTLKKTTDRMGINNTLPLTALAIKSREDDTVAVVTKASSGTNSASTREFVGDREPEDNITGNPGDVYRRIEGVQSGNYENRSASADTVWFKQSVFPSDIITLHNSTELDALASGGIITIAVNTTWRIRGPLTTANRIVVNSGIGFTISGEFNQTATLTYSGTDTFITNNGFLQIRANATLISTSTGTFLNSTENSILVFDQSQYVGWDVLGTITDAIDINFTFTLYENVSAGYIVTDTLVVNIRETLQFGTDLTGAFFTINTNKPDSVNTFADTDLRNLAVGSSVLDLDTRINKQATTKIISTALQTGDLFKQATLANATINSVADGSIATGTITAMADNGSGGTTISSTTTYFEDEEVAISGTTSYNGTFQIFNVVAGVSFDTITTFVADDATGSVDTVRLTLTLAGGHGIVAGDNLKIIDTKFYNGFQTALNVATNDLTLNGTFVSTNTGSIERNVSIDQTDPRVIALFNNGFPASALIAAAFVNDNSTANGAIVNNTFTDMVFGTVGAALNSSDTMERWKLVDELNGTFEYTGNLPFDGSISFDFTTLSSGGTVDFRFKWQIDKGAGFVDLSDNVEALVAVGSDSQSVSKTYPLRAVLGDRVKPQITRNSASSAITATYVTIFIGM